MRRSFVAGFRLQLWLTRTRVDDLLLFCTLPLSTMVYLSIMLDAERMDLLANALIAPILIGLWLLSISVASSMIEDERWQGTLELAVATPAELHSLLSGRVCAVTCFGLVPLVESWLLAWLLFDVTPVVWHVGVFVVALVLTAMAMAGTTMALIALFALSRNTQSVQSILSYPVYVLSGVLVPVVFLPELVRPFSRLSFLYWAADLLRDCLAPGPVRDVLPRLGMIAALGAAGFAAGYLLLRWVLRRLRTAGTMAHA